MLTIKKYQTFVISETFSQIGNELMLFFVPIIAIVALKFNPLEVSILAACGTSPSLFFSLSIGEILDRYNKKIIMILSNLIRALLTMFLIILMYFDKLNIINLSLIVFLSSTCAIAFDCAILPVLSDISAKNDLMKANSLVEIGRSISSTVGQFIAGVLYKIIAMPFILLIDILSFISSSIVLLYLPIRSKNNTKNKNNHIKEIIVGIKELWLNKVQRYITISAGIFNFFHAWFFAIFSYYALKVIMINPFELAISLSMVGLFGILSSLTVKYIVNIFGYWKVLFLTFLVISPIGIALVFLPYVKNSYISTIIIILVLGLWEFFVIINVIVDNTLRQKTVDNKMLSRVTATSRFISWGVDPIGALTGGFISFFIGIKLSLLIAILGFSFAALPIFFSKTIRDFNK